jgi:hypothetical protein
MPEKILTFVIGHRGVGKSGFLRRVSVYRPAARCIDLRAELAAREGLPLETLIRSEGESGLRVRERTLLERLLGEMQPPADHEPAPFYIELDPDFMAFDLPVFALPGTEILWVRRRSDRVGRIFTGTPRSPEDAPPIQDFLERARFRERRFERLATRQLLLREGQIEISDEENAFVLGSFSLTDASCIVADFDLQSGRELPQAGSYVLDPAVLELAAQERATEVLPAEKCILRVRSETDSAIALQRGWREDRALPLAGASAARSLLISIFDFEKDRSIDEVLGGFEAAVPDHAAGAVMKVEARVRDWAELGKLHQWRLRGPASRVVLPCSEDGRWRWYHQLMSGRQSISTFQTGDEAPDVPSVLESLRLRIRSAESGFHLSDRTAESSVPLYLDRWFRERGMVIVEGSAEIEEFSSVIPLLEDLGVTRISLGGRFQLAGFELCEGRVSLRARRVGFVDTLVHGDSGWRGDACSVAAVRKVSREWRRRSGVREPRDPREIAYVGPDAGFAPVREEFPQAVHWKKREAAQEGFRPDLVIFGEVRSRQAEVFSGVLPDVWRPRWVVDLVGAEDSPGREYALRCGARYLSGDLFEKELAQERQVYWSEQVTLLPALFRRKSNG